MVEKVNKLSISNYHKMKIEMGKTKITYNENIIIQKKIGVRRVNFYLGMSGRLKGKDNEWVIKERLLCYRGPG